jgi:periplasmic protein TonB
MALPEPSGQRDFLNPILIEKPIWRGLYESMHDRFFPVHLPPLELTSTPIPVPAVVQSDPVASRNTAFHIDNFPLFAPSRAASSNGGQSGGTNDPLDPNKVRLPKLDLNAIEKVQVPLLDHPRLALDNSLAVPPDVQLPDNPAMPLIGVHNSTNVTVVSGGPGSHGGIGFGPDGGYGPGSGTGWGPGTGDGVYVPGRGGVSQPIPIFTPEAEFSDEARRQKYEGVCMISVIIDAQGNPQSPRVVRRLGMGLDEKALTAVMKYRFKPARKDGKPVAVRIAVMVDFRLF